ncbi:hypothetical protein BDM02DRAFT_3128683 [Thelephora ganbajun]|uniref:Uncharacterized protein n=1 Tax=Thelephora ganbajun TaxID=370292 RepID=A0ACB6ZIE0_THEGA|nr:hypothetical protein BDM02DRAFT_3128683 [Thelephora ganbajun]
MTLPGWPEQLALVVVIKCLTGPGMKAEVWEGVTEGREEKGGVDGGETVVEGEAKVDERRDWSGESVEAQHLPMVPTAPTAPLTPANDSPPPEGLPDDRRQSGVPTDRVNGEGITPSPLLEKGDVAL